MSGKTGRSKRMYKFLTTAVRKKAYRWIRHRDREEFKYYKCYH